MIGLTSEATRCNIARARSAFGRSFKWAKDFTNDSGMVFDDTGGKWQTSKSSIKVEPELTERGGDASLVGFELSKPCSI